MNNVTFIDSIDPMTGATITNVIIDRGNGEFTSMLKSTYDTLVSNSSTPQAGN
jgi:hypothetical protein